MGEKAIRIVARYGPRASCPALWVKVKSQIGGIQRSVTALLIVPNQKLQVSGTIHNRGDREIPELTKFLRPQPAQEFLPPRSPPPPAPPLYEIREITHVNHLVIDH